jgi:hypothetical protein
MSNAILLMAIFPEKCFLCNGLIVGTNHTTASIGTWQNEVRVCLECVNYCLHCETEWVVGGMFDHSMCRSSFDTSDEFEMLNGQRDITSNEHSAGSDNDDDDSANNEE